MWPVDISQHFLAAIESNRLGVAIPKRCVSGLLIVSNYQYACQVSFMLYNLKTILGNYRQ